MELVQRAGHPRGVAGLGDAIGLGSTPTALQLKAQRRAAHAGSIENFSTNPNGVSALKCKTPLGFGFGRGFAYPGCAARALGCEL